MVSDNLETRVNETEGLPVSSGVLGVLVGGIIAAGSREHGTTEALYNIHPVLLPAAYILTGIVVGAVNAHEIYRYDKSRGESRGEATIRATLGGASTALFTIGTAALTSAYQY